MHRWREVGVGLESTVMWQLEQVRWGVTEGEWRGAGGGQTHIEGRMGRA